MVSAKDAIAYARSLCGGKDKKGNWIIMTPYSKMDCIGLIKNIIWNCPGGVKDYRTSGTNTLWKSYDASPKYKDLTWRQEGIKGAKAGMLAFMESGGDVSHVGLVTGEGTIIHSSKSAGGVIESEFTEKRLWNLLAVHRYIGVAGSEREVETLDEILYTAVVRTSGGALNLRSGPDKAYGVTAKIPNGTELDVYSDGDWCKVEFNGAYGYVDASFLEKNERRMGENITIVDDEGNIFRPSGGFRVYVDGID